MLFISKTRDGTDPDQLRGPRNGFVPAAVRSSEEHFDWLALYQCADASL
jgi:hypothetical protein